MLTLRMHRMMLVIRVQHLLLVHQIWSVKFLLVKRGDLPLNART